MCVTVYLCVFMSYDVSDKQAQTTLCCNGRGRLPCGAVWAGGGEDQSVRHRGSAHDGTTAGRRMAGTCRPLWPVHRSPAPPQAISGTAHRPVATRYRWSDTGPQQDTVDIECIGKVRVQKFTQRGVNFCSFVRLTYTGGCLDISE